MKEKLKRRLMIHICIIVTLLSVFTISLSLASDDNVSLFSSNNLSISHDDIRVLDGTWIGDSNQEALAIVKTSTDDELHLCILQKVAEDSYSVVSMSAGFLSSADYYNNPHQLLDHMKDGHPYFDITTDRQWVYIEFEKNDSGEWLVSSLLIENQDSGERITCNCDVDTLSVWVFSIRKFPVFWY